MKQVRKSSMEILDETVEDMLKSLDAVDEDELDPEFDEDLEEGEEFDEDGDIDEDRELSSQFEEDDITDWDDNDDNYTTGKARKLDASYGGPNMPSKPMTPVEYSKWYSKWLAKKGIAPDNTVAAKSVTAGLDEEAMEAIEVSSFLRSLTKSIDNNLGGLAGIVADNMRRQNEFNYRLAKALKAQSAILQGIMTAPAGRRTAQGAYQILGKSQGSEQLPSTGVIRKVLMKSVQAGEIDPLVLANFECSNGQVTPEIENILLSKNLI